MRFTRPTMSMLGNKEIIFPKLESWNPMTEVATIAAEVNKNRVLCRVAIEDVKHKFDCSVEEPMQAVAAHRAAIQDAARRLIEQDAFEEDGSIMIRAQDL